MLYTASLEQKIKTPEELLPCVEALKQQGKTIVSNNGAYDILHFGHIAGLLEAKAQGDILIIGVNSDASIRQYKNPNRPINPAAIRMRMLAALSMVDYVFCFEETTPIAWLTQLQPDIHTNGAEYGHDCIERETVESYGGKLYLLSMQEGFKTSDLIAKIRAM